MLELSVVNDTGSALSAVSPTVIKIIGCGGGGSSAVNRMIDAGVENVEFVVLNTDLQALAGSKAQKRVAIGQKLTGGLGAGGNPLVGENAAKEDTEIISNVVKGADMVIITAGMGGGTGTGSAPVVAKIAHEQGSLTIAVVTTPFAFEGPVRMRYAEDGLKKLREAVDSLIVIPNQQIMKIVDKKINYRVAFKMADDVLCQGVQGVSDIITKPGVVNVDFADVKSVMKDQGEAILGVGVGEGEDRANQAAQAAINNPLLADRQIDGAKSILVNITSSEELAMSEIEDIINDISENANKEHQLFWGQVLDPDMGEKVSVTVIATGFNKTSEDAIDAEKEAEPEDDNVMSYGDFQTVLHGKSSLPDNEKSDSVENISSTSLSNPGLFDDNANKNISVPHENAPLDEDGKRTGSLSDALKEASKLNRNIEPPEGYKCNSGDLTQPAVWRNLNGLTRTINLTDDGK
ncbi:MAG: cell division protein FtsZ [Treponema sp.]